MGLKVRIINSIKVYSGIILGSFITAAAINVFLVPYRIAPGGVSGIATVVFYLTRGKFPVGMTMLLLNIPLFILGIRFIGKRFALRTLFGTFFLSLVIDLSQPYTKHFVDQYLVKLSDNPSQPDLLLYSLDRKSVV